ncbi:hypothetical protein [Pseudoalteromonas sp. Of11M-6]|uniref:hypothetical protein n=1 Tax=Pseudoalteromonas sp. Of11M-6 TaxID=2917754 RepID=UPI001EF4C0EF|nr:hypothetical protein [Pseudoalteromonas sp. Of11M-6]MCG7552040.1 hypothetical protein [Pseudoalteromonas sp. Of11M-6]
MATFQELARDYAKRIKDAIASDGFTSRSRISPQDLRGSRTLQEAKQVKREIDGLIYKQSKKPLSEDDKRKIIEQIDQELGLPRNIQKSYNIVESASNDDLADLADEIENVLGGKK